MHVLPLDRLGGRVSGRRLEFGVLLPGVTNADFDVAVRVIHADDQFLQDVPPAEVPLTHSLDARHGDCWAGGVDLDGMVGAGPSWGRDGRYVYRLVVRRGADELDWIIDPFARDFGTGKLSAVVVGEPAFDWGPAEDEWRTPLVEDLVFYEIDLAEYGRDLAAVVNLRFAAMLIPRSSQAQAAPSHQTQITTHSCRSLLVANGSKSQTL